MTIQVERATGLMGGGNPFVVGVRVDDGSRRRVLAGVDVAEPGARLDIQASRAIDLGTELPPAAALLVPHVVTALQSWDTVVLELGTAAVLTPGPWSALLSTVAGWYGAKPLLVGVADRAASDVDAIAGLKATFDTFPAVAAIELSGRADMVDLLLESIPRYSRVLFAGPAGDRLTIDYYVNVHRKGLHLSSTVLSPARVFTDGVDRRLLERTARLLMAPARVAACEAALDADFAR